MRGVYLMSDSDRSRKGGEIVVSPKEDLTPLIESFTKEYGIQRIIAFSGGSDDRPEGIEDDKLSAALGDILRQKEAHIIAQAVKRLEEYNIAILCGGTKWGVPSTIAKEARKVGLPTIGIFPLAGKKHALDAGELDLRIQIEPEFGVSRWGDESSIYAKLLDGMIVYGGNAGTLVEVAHVLKINEAILDRNETPKFIVPISGSGGVADGLPFIWAKSRVRAVSIPQEKVVSGVRAAQLLIEKLNLHDFPKL